MKTTSRFVALVLLASLSVGARCNPPPPPTDGAPIVTPTSWTDTARTVVEITSWSIPAMRLIVPVLGLTSQQEVFVLRAIDAVRDEALPAFSRALDVYDHTPTPDARCQARRAADSLVTALLGLADALGSCGFDIAPDIHAALGGLGAIVDQLTGTCLPDSGFYSIHRTIGTRLEARPSTLRPFPPLLADAGHP